MQKAVFDLLMEIYNGRLLAMVVFALLPILRHRAVSEGCRKMKLENADNGDWHCKMV
jgi:hypothetical protein